MEDRIRTFRAMLYKQRAIEERAGICTLTTQPCLEGLRPVCLSLKIDAFLMSGPLRVSLLEETPAVVRQPTRVPRPQGSLCLRSLAIFEILQGVCRCL